MNRVTGTGSAVAFVDHYMDLFSALGGGIERGAEVGEGEAVFASSAREKYPARPAGNEMDSASGGCRSHVSTKFDSGSGVESWGEPRILNKTSLSRPGGLSHPL